jgi:LytR cell envelope-related transcriptional attenuator
VVNVPGQQRKPSNGSPGGESRLPPFRAAIVIVVFVAATVLLLGVIHPQQANVASGSTTPASSDTTTTTTTAKGHSPPTTTTTIPPSSVAVLVANASGVTGAAATISARLAPGGWHLLAPVNASSDVSTSSVYYVAGQQKPAATVASSLGLPASSVVPYTTAAPVPTIGTADVVVVAGPDVSTTTTTTTSATAG